MLALTTTMMSTWESSLAFFVTPFINGGGPTVMYGYIFAFLGSLATAASMAEMASMYPISGAQYHWTALLAPPRHAKFLSWLTGWISTMAWQAAAATGLYLAGTVIQSLVSFNFSTYSSTNWQATLMLYAVLLLTVVANTVLIRILPAIEGLVLVFHVLGFFGIIIPLVYLAPISSNEFVWTEFLNLSQYKSDGVSWIIGQSTIALLFIGYDGAAHMAEEVKNAAVNVPRAMMFSICVNGVFGFAAFIVILYCFGDPLDTMNPMFPFPFLLIFYNGVQSRVATTVMASIIVAMFIFATFGFFASASRQAWAFSRNNGLPLSGIFKRVCGTYSSLLCLI